MKHECKQCNAARGKYDSYKIGFKVGARGLPSTAPVVTGERLPPDGNANEYRAGWEDGHKAYDQHMRDAAERYGLMAKVVG
jgi:hypothetical protein